MGSGALFRQALEAERPLQIVGTINAYTALLAGKAGFRAVPNCVVRKSAYIAPGVVLMPSFVNLGAYVDNGTMVDTWATVVNIGLRTSVLLTQQNVEIIVPNSTIGNNRVVNHSYPDSRLRLQTHVEIAFGADVERTRQVLIGAVRQVDGVLADEPVDALYIEVGDSGMIFRLRWWTYYYRDPEESFDSVHTAVHKALAEEGIESPYPRQTLDVDIDDRTLVEVWQAWDEEEGRG